MLAAASCRGYGVTSWAKAFTKAQRENRNLYFAMDRENLLGIRGFSHAKPAGTVAE